MRRMQNKYRLLINGKNFMLNLEQERKYGFYTHRYVEASSEDMAVKITLNLIRDELRNQVKNEKFDPPKMYVEEIVKVESFVGQKASGLGFTFYPDKGDIEI